MKKQTKNTKTTTKTNPKSTQTKNKQTKSLNKPTQTKNKPTQIKKKQTAKEYALMKAGLDKQGRQQFTAVRVYNKKPNGWNDVKGAMTAPDGTKWIDNGKSITSGKYQSALVKSATPKTTTKKQTAKKTVKKPAKKTVTKKK